jgi:glutamate synthase domain-containing protein 1
MALSATWRDDKFHDECGLFGIWNHPEAANVAYLGLYALQHRGQESAGIVATDGHNFHLEKAMGWVADVFSPERLRRLPGHRAIGHVRYSTAGSSNIRNASRSRRRSRAGRSPSPTTATSPTPTRFARTWSATGRSSSRTPTPR